MAGDCDQNSPRWETRVGFPDMGPKEIRAPPFLRPPFRESNVIGHAGARTQEPPEMLR